MDIVFLTPNIHFGSSAQIWLGMTSRIENDRLFILSGGRFGATKGTEAKNNRLYELLGTRNFQTGISWVSALGGILSKQAVQKVHENFRGIPWVAIGAELPGAPTLVIDAYSGMSKLLAHMADAHGCRRFGFIRGPVNHLSAEERYRAFVDFVSKRDLKWNEQQVLGPTDWTAGDEVMREAIENDSIVPGKDFQVLVGASDLLCHKAAMYLRRQGFDYPKDYLIGGFNNSPESRLSSPGFTTIHMPFERIGAQALELARKGSPGILHISPRLVLRKSCGCFVTKTETETVRTTIDEESWTSTFRQTLLESFPGEEDEKQGIVEAIVTRLGESLKKREVDLLLSDLENILEKEREVSMYQWQQAFEATRRLCSALLGPEHVRFVEGLFEQIRVLLNDIGEKKSVRDGWNNRQVVNALQNFDHALWSFGTLGTLSKILHEHLGSLGIPSCYLVRVQKDIPSLAAGFFPGGLIDEEYPFESGLILPPSYFRKLQGGNAWFVLPLADEQAIYGYILVQFGPESAEIYDQVRISLTGAMRNFALVEQLTQARDRARRADETKDRFLTHAGTELLSPVQELIRVSETFPDPLVAQFRRNLESLQQLTKDLGDFSRSQAEDLVMTPIPIDARSLLGTVYPRASQLPPVPLVHGDSTRLGQVIDGLCHRAGTKDGRPEKVEIQGVRQGIRISLIFRQEWDSDSLLQESISQVLYRRILLLHGGNLVRENIHHRGVAHLELPYPSFRDTLPAHPNGGPFLVVTGENQEEAPLLGIEFVRQIRGEILYMSPDDLFTNLPAKVDGVLFDPEVADLRQWKSLLRLRNHKACQDAALLVFPGQSLPQNSEGLSLWEGLSLHKGALGAGPTVCIKGGNTSFENLFLTRDTDWLNLDKPEDLSLLGQDQVPRVILYLGLPDFPLKQLRNRGGWEAVPIIVISESFKSPLIEESLLEDRVYFLHLGVLSPEEFADHLEGLYERSGLFVSQTTYMIRRAIIYIDQNCTQSLFRWKMAEELHVSEDYFTRVFHREIGITPWEYLTRLRMIQAGKLLQSTGLTIQEIARETGYTDQAYFCRVFRKTRGTTPSAYRRQGI